MSFGIRLRRLQGDPVFAEDVHGGAGDWFLILDRKKKDLLTVVGPLFGDDSEIGHEDKPTIPEWF